MKQIALFATVVGMLILAGCRERVTVQQLEKFRPTETYPDDVFLETTSNKRALVIVAHDDDDCAMSGTIAKLTQKGWYIRQLSLQNHIPAGSDKNPAGLICEGNELILPDGNYRPGLDTMQHPYYPIPYASIKTQFLTEKVTKAIIQKVNMFKPSVIFTLDNVKGGYGHPEHIFISQLVKDLYDSNSLDVEKIYQSVYTHSMEHEIVDTWLAANMKKWNQPDASSMANALYGINGMPEPTVQINIASVANKKMSYLLAYDENVRKNLRKFIPYYESFDAKTYFHLFDREFFRVITHKAAPAP